MPNRRLLCARTQTAGKVEPRRVARSAALWSIGLALFIQSVVQINTLFEYHIAGDFLNQTYNAGSDVLAGNATWLTRGLDTLYTTAPYPPPVVVALSPLAWLPQGLAVLLWLVCLAITSVAILRVLGVRDSRCQLLWLLSPPVVTGLYSGNLSLLMILGLALMWRYRDRAAACAAAATALATVKLWPIVLVAWMWTTGRRRAAVYTAIATPVVILSTWAALGMDGFVDYPSKLDDFSERYASHSVSLTSVLVHADVSLSVASLVVAALATLLLARALRADEVSALVLVLAAGLVVSPIVWFHYFGWLVVPIAIRTPSFSVLWLYFPALWLAADLNIAGHLPAAAAVATATTAVLVVQVVRGTAARRDVPVAVSSVGGTSRG